MTQQELIEKVRRFETFKKESKKLRAWPAYRIEQEEKIGEEAILEIHAEFNKLRNEMISIFHIKGQSYNHGTGLNAQQIAERKITEEYAIKYYNKYLA